MRRKVWQGLAAAFVVGALIAPTASAQSKYLGGGTTGLGFDIAALALDGGSGFGGSAGFSVAGVLDLGLGVKRYSFDEQAGAVDVAAVGIVPSAGLTIRPKNGLLPIGLTLNVSYEWVTFTDDFLDDLQIDMTGSFVSIGGGIWGQMRLSSMFDLYPTVNVSHRESILETTDPLGNGLSSEETGTEVAVTPALGLSLGPVSILSLNPTVTVSDARSPTYEVSVGIALPIFKLPG